MPHSRTRTCRLNHSIVIALGCLGVAVAVSASAASPFDGVYRGPQKTTRGASYTDCQNLDHDTTVRIQDGQFTAHWGSAKMDVTVAPNGSFDATGGTKTSGRQAVRAAELKGQITGNQLEADIGTPYCGAHWSLTKS